MPRISPSVRQWLDEIFPVLMESPAHLTLRRDALLISGFLTGFQIGYLHRGRKTAAPITRGGAERMGVSKESVHSAAIAHLTKDSAGATFKLFDSEEGAVLLFDSEGGLHSSRLLLPGLYPWLHKFIEGPFVVGVPNRDVLIAVAETNRTALDGLPDDIDASYRGRRYPLTGKMFRVTAGGVALIS